MNFEFMSFEFVSDFEIRISDLPIYIIAIPACPQIPKLGLGGIDIIEYLRQSSRAWIIDAGSFGIVPGTIRRYTGGSFPSYYKSRISSHFIGLDELIKVGCNLFPAEMPGQIELILIEGENFLEFTTGLSNPVELAAREVINSFLQLFHS